MLVKLIQTIRQSVAAPAAAAAAYPMYQMDKSCLVHPRQTKELMEMAAEQIVEVFPMHHLPSTCAERAFTTYLIRAKSCRATLIREIVFLSLKTLSHGYSTNIGANVLLPLCN